MKKFAIVAAAVSALSVPAHAQTFGAGVTGAQQASASQVCGSRGFGLIGAELNAAGQLVVTCSRPAAAGQGAGAAAGAGGTIAAGLAVAFLVAVAAGGGSSTVTTVP